METKFQTSFIPKAPISGAGSGTVHKSVNFFVFLSTLIFIGSVAAAGATYGYLQYVQSEQVKTKADLDKNIKDFEPQTIEQYVRLGNRLSTARALLAKHVAVSNIFGYLSDATLKTIRFNDFKYDLGADGSVNLVMNGEAKNYNSVAYQSEVFGQKKDLINPIFSNLDRDDKGSVVFNLMTGIDPSFIYYSRTLSSRKDIFSPKNNINNATDTPNNLNPNINIPPTTNINTPVTNNVPNNQVNQNNTNLPNDNRANLPKINTVPVQTNISTSTKK